MIKRISFIGSGSVAINLALAFKKAGLRIVEVYSPTKQNAEHFAEKTACKVVEKPEFFDTTSDLYLIAVPDDRVKEISEHLKLVDGIVAHTSGNSGLKVLSGKNKRGVFYPLQTFSVKREQDLTDVPICVEGEDDDVQNNLKRLGETISRKVVEIDSDQRKYLHLAAVMVNNFTNHLYRISGEILDGQRIDFNLLMPLIKETAMKIQDISPADSQTGPAKRHDIKTIQEHIQLLNDYPEYQKLYQLFTDQIIKNHYE